jgi:hypothetical protein
MNHILIGLAVGAGLGAVGTLILAFLLVRPWLHRLLDEEEGVIPRLIRVVGEVADRVEEHKDQLAAQEHARLEEKAEKDLGELLG